MSADGFTLWTIFSAYGPGAKEGINTHDRFNLIELTLSKSLPPKPVHPTKPAP
jgi:hypothetical protein